MQVRVCTRKYYRNVHVYDGFKQLQSPYSGGGLILECTAPLTRVQHCSTRTSSWARLQDCVSAADLNETKGRGVVLSDFRDTAKLMSPY